MLRIKTTAPGRRAQAGTQRRRVGLSSIDSFSDHLLLCSSMLIGGFLLVNGAPAYAAPCSGAVDTANSTQCIGGATADTLDYSPITDGNAGYAGGDFTLQLQSHDVTAAGNGIEFGGVSVGDDGTILLDGNSNVIAGGNGIFSVADGATTKIEVNDTSSVSGVFAGIIAQSLANGGDVTVTTQAGTTVSGGAGGVGILAVVNAGVGNVVVNAQGGVTSPAAAAIFASAATGTTQVTTGAVAISGVTIGIGANANTGSATVTTGTGAVTASAGTGIDATASGAVTVDASGAVSGGIHGINAVSSAAGNVEVETFGSLLGPADFIQGNGGAGINAGTTGAGLVTITNLDHVRGTVAGIVATSGGGAIKITNNRVVMNVSGSAADLAIRTVGGPATIDNSSTGLINGRVETGAGADTLTNNNLWNTQGDSDFGGGTDIVNNNSTLFATNAAGVAETTRFLNLETFNNNGTIRLHDQFAGDGSNISDRLETSGNFFPTTGGTLEIDAFLGGAGSVADVLVIGGSVSGTTRISVTDTNPGAGAFDPAGILVVDVSNGGTADATNFALAGGPIVKGLFTYDLVFDDPTNNYYLVGLPGQEVFEPTAAMASAQEIFRETADAWSTRQENLRDLLSAKRTITSVADPGSSASDAPMTSLWVSALGSWSERDDDASFALAGANLDFDLSYKQDIYGMVGGADFRAEMGTHTSLLFGVMAGYVDSQLDFDESSTSIDTNGATVGGYAALMSNGFFATILVKADLLDMEYAAAGDSDNANVTSYGARGDLGFRFGDAGLFVEPMLSMDALSTEIDEFEIAGADVDAGTNESFRVGAGVRVGFGGEDIRASATARVWDVFSTDNEVDIPGLLAISDDDLEGIYGDVSGQIDVSLSSNTTLYVKGGILFSEDVTKPKASGGFAFYW